MRSSMIKFKFIEEIAFILNRRITILNIFFIIALIFVTGAPVYAGGGEKPKIKPHFSTGNPCNNNLLRKRENSQFQTNLSFFKEKWSQKWFKKFESVAQISENSYLIKTVFLPPEENSIAATHPELQKTMQEIDRLMVSWASVAPDYHSILTDEELERLTDLAKMRNAIYKESSLILTRALEALKISDVSFLVQKVEENKKTVTFKLIDAFKGTPVERVSAIQDVFFLTSGYMSELFAYLALAKVKSYSFSLNDFDSLRIAFFVSLKALSRDGEKGSFLRFKNKYPYLYDAIQNNAKNHKGTLILSDSNFVNSLLNWILAKKFNFLIIEGGKEQPVYKIVESMYRSNELGINMLFQENSQSRVKPTNLFRKLKEANEIIALINESLMVNVKFEVLFDAKYNEIFEELLKNEGIVFRKIRN